MLLDITKISYEAAELFLSANDKTVPILHDKLYQEVRNLLEQYDEELYYPDEINNYRIACELSFSPHIIDVGKYKTSNILAGGFGQLIVIAQQLKLGQVEQEQILQILNFLNLLDDTKPYLEIMNRDVYKNIFQYLHHNDIINLCQSSKVIKTCVSNLDNRTFFFPSLKDNTLNEKDFYNYLQTYLSLITFKQNIIFGVSGFYYLKDNVIIFYNWEHEKKIVTINKEENITQIININHNLYVLFNDGIIVTKNLITDEETISIPVKNYVYVAVYKEELLLVTIEGYNYFWNGDLRKIYGPKYIVQIVDLNKTNRLVLTCNGKLYLSNDNYSTYDLCNNYPNIIQISNNGRYLLSSERQLNEICFYEGKLKLVQNISYGVSKILDCNGKYFFLTTNGTLLHQNEKCIKYASNIFFARRTDYRNLNRIYYISKGKLYYRTIGTYGDILEKDEYVITL